MTGTMRKVLKTFFIVVAVVLLGGALWFWHGPARGIRVGTAVVSKSLCSGAFVSGLDPDQLYAEAIKPIPGQDELAKRLKYKVDRAARQVTATWLGVFESRAIYREGFGCMLVHGELSGDSLPTQGMVRAKYESSALGIASRSAELEVALNRAFAEPAAPPYRRVKAIVILHDGKLVAERYADGYTTETPILGYSLAKSVTNALIGILVRQKKLSVEQRAPVAAWEHASDPRREITIDALLRMSSGLAIEESDTGLDPVSRMLFLEPDMAGFAERAQLKAVPGATWEYTSGNTLILSRIIRDAVGGHAQEVAEFARRELFEPLGITTATIEFDSTGTPVGSIYVLASARDWARFGELYLNDGIVNGQRILPEGWVSYSALPTLASDYGAGFWTNRGAHANGAKRIEAGMPEDAFYGSGNLGQRVVIIPSERLVIVRLGLTHSEGFDMRGLLRLIRDTSEALNARQ
jgi:CubicO group peptidase (beta-lactamase class C family)